jgi:hypothetical protein
MTVCRTVFHRSLYLQHAEELADFYLCREPSLANPELTWLDHENDEQRAEAHLDALVIGHEAALDAVLHYCDTTTPEYAFVATALFCRLNQLRPFFSWFTPLSLDDQEFTAAMRSALLMECPPSWLMALNSYPFTDYPQLLTLFMPVYARDQIPVPGEWGELLLQQPNGPAALHIRTLHRLACPLPPQAVNQWLVDSPVMTPEQQQIEYEIITALLHKNDPVIPHLYASALHTHHHRLPALTLGADFESLKQLFHQPIEAWQTHQVTAIGYAGLAAGIPALLAVLNHCQSKPDPVLARTAAEALFHISGARFTETVFEADTWDEDELFPEERQGGQPPSHPDGRPFGEWREALATQPEPWAHWWRQHQSSFLPDQRYRLGMPLNALTLIKCLEHPSGAPSFRRACYDEWRIRFRGDFHFDPAAPLIQQRISLSKMQDQSGI